MLSQDQALKIVQAQGPLLPSRLAKAIGTNILFASAMLSELTSTNKIKISNTKVDGSPVYYVLGQESKLQNLYEHLNEKDKRTFDLLKEKKVLNDVELEPLTRVSLRGIKDFAVPLNVQNEGVKYLFWKWYLLTQEEAETQIKSYLDSAIKRQEPKKPEKNEEKLLDKDKQEELKRMQVEKEEIEKQKKELEKLKTEFEKQKKETSEKQKEEKKTTPELEVKKKEQKKHIEKKTDENEVLTRVFEKKQEKQTISQVNDPFLSKINEFLSSKNIEVIEFNIIRKNAEIDLLLKVPSVVGTLDYYCKAKNKKRVSDSDLSSAFVQSQLKKLPGMMLVNGDLNKKAKELLETEFKKNLVIQRF